MLEPTAELQETEERDAYPPQTGSLVPNYSILIDAPRPLAEFARIVGSRFGEPVTYEDPPFVYRGDLRPLRAGVAGDVPRNIYETVTYPMSASLKEVALAITDAHNALQIGGVFAARQVAGVWGFLPSHYRSSDGRVVAHQSLLDEPVTDVLAAECSCMVALESAIAEVSREHPDVSVVLGRFPKGPLSRLRFPQDAVVRSARETLNRILNVANVRLSGSGSLLTWQFRFSPGSSRNQEMWILEFQRTEARAAKAYLLSVESARPIASAIDIVQRHFPVSISYEEPSLGCSCDLLGVLGDGSAGLAGGVINIEWHEQQHGAAEMLEFITHAPIEPRDPAGMFGVQQVDKNRFHVFPKMQRDATGQLVLAESLLKKEVSTDDLRGSIAEVASECAARALGIRQVRWDAGSKALAKALAVPVSRTFGSRSIPAQTVIDKVLASLSAPLSWQLRFEPSSATHRLYFYMPMSP